MAKAKLTPQELSDEEQAVADAAADVAAARKVLDEATATHESAVATHEAARKALLPTADPSIHIGIDDGKGGYSLLEHPEAKDKLPRLVVGGRNVEHVSDGENGVWVYRSM